MNGSVLLFCWSFYAGDKMITATFIWTLIVLLLLLLRLLGDLNTTNEPLAGAKKQIAVEDLMSWQQFTRHPQRGDSLTKHALTHLKRSTLPPPPPPT